MWISVNNQGLFAYDPRTQILRNHFFENGRQTLPVNIRALHVDGDNGLWIGLFYHSFLYIGHDSADHPRRDDAREIAAFRNDNVAAVSSAPDDSETIYVASARRGALPAEPQQRPYPDADPVPSRGIHARRPVMSIGRASSGCPPAKACTATIRGPIRPANSPATAATVFRSRTAMPSRSSSTPRTASGSARTSEE